MNNKWESPASSSHTTANDARLDPYEAECVWPCLQSADRSQERLGSG